MTYYFLAPPNWYPNPPLWFPQVGSGGQSGSPINKPAPRTSGQVQFPKSCCTPKPCFVADYTFTARKGDKSATVTRQARSEFSYEHARALARILAMNEANLEVAML